MKHHKFRSRFIQGACEHEECNQLEDAEIHEPGSEDGEIYQILLGFAETNNLTAFITHREICEGKSITPEQSESKAGKIKRFLDEKMMEAQREQT